MSYITSFNPNKFTLGNDLERTIEPKTQYFKLKIKSYTGWTWEEFSKYCYNKNIFEVNKEDFKNILAQFEIKNLIHLFSHDINSEFTKLYGARYIGYSYFFDWRVHGHEATYKYYFHIRNKKKFSYARLKFEF
jgi:hypothetical protein